ncbi:hypothetical protein AEQ48_25765 [Pseudomonas libanensis]|uniref:Uncharacterized protein n=1 Tax=Pseudomonas libanensis TaxID=75588 RepID=A0ABR5M117_9PSED|nr:hypothetical protein AEQ48_25765 [Pseudomonas libanensis]
MTTLPEKVASRLGNCWSKLKFEVLAVRLLNTASATKAADSKMPITAGTSVLLQQQKRRQSVYSTNRGQKKATR